MESIIWLFFVCAGGEVLGRRLIDEVIHLDQPVHDYYPYQVESYGSKPALEAVPFRMRYIHYPEKYYYSSDKEESDEFNDNESEKKSFRDAQQTGLKTVEGTAGDRQAYADTAGRYAYEVAQDAKKTSGEGAVVSEESKEYGKLAKDEYGGNDNVRYTKGHKNSGFEKSYHNEESGKDSHFYDEEHKAGGEMYGKTFGGMAGEGGRVEQVKANSGAGYKQEERGHGKGGSVTKSSTSHDTKTGHSGRKDLFNGRDISSRKDLSGAFHERQYKGQDERQTKQK